MLAFDAIQFEKASPIMGDREKIPLYQHKKGIEI